MGGLHDLHDRRGAGEVAALKRSQLSPLAGEGEGDREEIARLGVRGGGEGRLERGRTAAGVPGAVDPRLAKLAQERGPLAARQRRRAQRDLGLLEQDRIRIGQRVRDEQPVHQRMHVLEGARLVEDLRRLGGVALIPRQERGAHEQIATLARIALRLGLAQGLRQEIAGRRKVGRGRGHRGRRVDP